MVGYFAKDGSASTDVGLPIPYGASEHRSADASSGQRLAIELSAMHQSYFEEDRRTWDLYEFGGDRLEWIATRTMVADCLTKSTDLPAEGTKGECAGCSHSTLSRYLITCIAHQHQKSRTSVNLSTLLLLYSLVVDVFFREFTFAAGNACIFELFGLNRALEHWANAQRKKRDRACQTTTKFISDVSSASPPARCYREAVGTA